jgi:hypothetical protein
VQHKENLHNKTINDTFVIQPMSHCGLFLGRECSLKLICYHFNDNLSFLFPFLPSFPLEYFGWPISRLIFQNRPRTRIFDISYNFSTYPLLGHGFRYTHYLFYFIFTRKGAKSDNKNITSKLCKAYGIRQRDKVLYEIGR